MIQNLDKMASLELDWYLQEPFWMNLLLAFLELNDEDTQFNRMKLKRPTKSK